MNSGCGEDVQELLRDAIQVVENSQDKMAESPLHIYRLLLDLPDDLLLRRSYEATAMERLRMADGLNYVNSDVRTQQSLWLKAKRAVLLKSRVVIRLADGKE